MLLTVDIGNTEITAGLFSTERLLRHWRMTTGPDRTPDEWGSAFGAFLIHSGHSPNEIKAVCLASVAPAITRSVIEGIELTTGAQVTSVTPRSELPLTLDVDDPFSVGADRIVNALAAIDRYGADTVVVDFGTATTFDCVTDGRFIGGAIMPGLRTSADQLTRRAAKLPATELEPPASAIGKRTEDCIQAGVLFGTADAVDGMIHRIRQEWPGASSPKVVATGGMARIVAPLTTTIEAVEPGLTLVGLSIAARHLGLSW